MTYGCKLDPNTHRAHLGLSQDLVFVEHLWNTEAKKTHESENTVKCPNVIKLLIFVLFFTMFKANNK